MTGKGALKALSKALFYFAIYFISQLLIIQIFSIGASVYVFASSDPSELVGAELAGSLEEMTAEDYQAYLQALTVSVTEKVLAITYKYSVHLTAISGLLTLLTLLIFFKLRKKRFTEEITLTRLSPQKCLCAFTLGASLNIFLSLVMSIIPFPTSWIDEYVESTSSISNETSISALLMIGIAIPIVEEVVFRGLCYTRLRRGLPMLAAMLINSWCFGLVHGTVIWTIYASLFGFILCWLFEKYRSLAACILLHCGFNLFGQITAMTSTISDYAFFLLLISSGIVSIALFIHIHRSSEYRIKLGMADEQK